MNIQTGPDIVRIQVGAFDVLTFNDGDASTYEVAANYSTMPEAVIHQLLQTHHLPLEEKSNLTPTLVQTGQHTVLIDAGFGQFPIPEDLALQLPDGPPPQGRILELLHAAGILPDAIDIVILTHVHPDHFAGLIHQGALAFPHAQIVLNRVEYDYWRAQPDLKGMHVSDDFKQLLAQSASDFLTLAQDSLILLDRLPEEIVPGITVEIAPGHTPGQLAARIASKGETVLVVGDVLHDLLSVAKPDLLCDYDTEPERAAHTRQRILAEAAATGTRLVAYHLPFPSLGDIEQTAQGYRWHPAVLDDKEPK